MSFTRLAEFDVLRPGYPNAIVTVYEAGTTRLASLFRDPQLTIPAANPQTLLAYTAPDGQTYGRWTEPLYTGVAYELDIDNQIRTGAQGVPITSLAGQNASAALVTPEGGTQARRLDSIAGDVVHTRNYGTLGDSALANTNILNAAIGRAAALGGGVVRIPAGTFEFTTLQVPEAVVLEGAGKGVTTLRSTVAEPAVTLGGNRASLRDLTLDGVNLVVGSVGVFAVGQDEVLLERAEIKRFATGIRLRGADRLRLLDFDLTNCTVGGEALGDTNSAATGQGGPIRTLQWVRGTLTLCTTAGFLLSFEDAEVVGVTIDGVDFLSNTGDALLLNGARGVEVRGGRFAGNTTNIRIRDDDDLSRVTDNTTRSIRVEGVDFQGGVLAFDGACAGVRYRFCDFKDVDFQLSIPDTAIVLQDCREDAATTATGATDRLQRQSSQDRGGAFPGITTDGVGITAWSYVLEPGEVVQVTARVIGRQRNGTNYFARTVMGIAARAAATIGFDNAVGTLAVGSIISGATSGASARIVAASQSGATGGLTVRDIIGAFQIGEALSTSAGQTARCITGLNTPTTSIPVDGVLTVGPSVGTDPQWATTINVESPSVRVQVQGDTDHIVEWTVEVDIQRP